VQTIEPQSNKHKPLVEKVHCIICHSFRFRARSNGSNKRREREKKTTIMVHASVCVMCGDARGLTCEAVGEYEDDTKNESERGNFWR
jgi:hypothetical protein